ncbi:TPA: MFS transporter [Candidatus Micrarchaeota archaeon]|nr:MFS transporter [Candidatus Micrarchaeota archaeon]
MLKNITNNGFARLVLIYVFWIAIAKLMAEMFDYKYLVDSGLDIGLLILLTIVEFAAPALLAAIIKRNESKKFVIIGAVIRIIAFLALLYWKGFTGAAVYFILTSLTNVLFWVPFNIAYFRKQHERSAFVSTIYYNTGPLLGIVLPALGGAMIEGVSFEALFLLMVAGYVLWLISVIKLWPDERQDIDIRAELKKLKGMKTLLFAESGYAAAAMLGIPLVTILYFQKPSELGLVASAMSIVAVVFSFMFAKISDKTKERMKYLVPFAIFLGMAMIISVLAYDAATWFIILMIMTIGRVLFFPFTTTILMDNQSKPEEVMYGRELVLNVGRVFWMVVIGIAYVATGSLPFGIAVCGIGMIAYPFVARLKEKRGHIVLS